MSDKRRRLCVWVRSSVIARTRALASTTPDACVSRLVEEILERELEQCTRDLDAIRNVRIRHGRVSANKR